MSAPRNESVMEELIAGITAIRTHDESKPYNGILLPEEHPMLEHAIQHLQAASWLYVEEHKAMRDEIFKLKQELKEKTNGNLLSRADL